MSDAELRFGIFDHLDKSGVPLPQFYADRLDLIEAYDRAGFYSFHSRASRITAWSSAEPQRLPRRHRRPHQAPAVRPACLHTAAL